MPGSFLTSKAPRSGAHNGPVRRSPAQARGRHPRTRNIRRQYNVSDESMSVILEMITGAIAIDTYTADLFTEEKSYVPDEALTAKLREINAGLQRVKARMVVGA